MNSVFPFLKIMSTFWNAYVASEQPRGNNQYKRGKEKTLE